jgi:hypothetical protein
MHDRDRFKLLFGPYRTPRSRYGDVVTCEMRGEVNIVGLSEARIPWPKCRTGKRGRAIILYGALAEAVRRESAQAIEYWWGERADVPSVSQSTPTAFRHFHRMSRWVPETIQERPGPKEAGRSARLVGAASP